MDIRWELASGNPFAQLNEGFQQGRQNARQKERDNLFAQQQAFEIQQAQRKQELQDAAMRRQEAVGGFVAKNDYAGARQAAGGDLDILKGIGELDEAHRKDLAEAAELTGRQLYALKGLPPEEQARRWAQIAPGLAQRARVDPNELAIDFNDPGAIDRELAEAMSLKDMIAQTAAEAKAKADREHQKVLERQGEARIGIARSNSARGWAAHNERKKAGGYGTPGFGGGGVVPDDDVEEN